MERTRAAQLFERYYVVVFRYSRALTREPDEARDLAQETFLRLLAHQEHVIAGQELAWLLRVAKNLLTDRERRRSLVPMVPLETCDVSVEGPGQDLAAVLSQALSRLPATDRQVFALREWGGLSHREIADVCGLSPNAVNSRLHRTRRTLQDILGDSARFGRREWKGQP